MVSFCGGANALSRYQKFTTQTINRKDIKTADYNPRLIDEENKKKLEDGLKKFGLVEPLIWNKRTKTLVSGHQRLSILDKLERSSDYELEVSVVDIDEKEEKILNVQLNNKSMQGDFDFDLLGDMALEFDINMADFGFSDFDTEMMFGANEKFLELLPDSKGVETAKADLKEIKEHRKEMNEKYSEEQNADFYFVVVCKNQKEKDEILNKMSVPNYEQYVTVDMLKRIMKGEQNG